MVGVDIREEDPRVPGIMEVCSFRNSVEQCSHRTFLTLVEVSVLTQTSKDIGIVGRVLDDALSFNYLLTYFLGSTITRRVTTEKRKEFIQRF